MSAPQPPAAPNSLPRQTLRIVQKALGWSLLLVLLMAVLLLLGLSWVTLTEAGTRWAMSTIRAYVPELAYGSLSGQFASPLRLQQVSFENENLALSIGSLVLQWQPAELLNLRLRVPRLTLDDVVLELRSGSSDDEAEPLALPELPVDIDVLQVDVARLTILTAVDISAMQDEPLKVDRLSATLRWNDEQLALTDVALVSEQLDFNADLALTFPAGLQTLSLSNPAERLQGSSIDLASRFSLRLPDLSPLRGGANITGPLSELSLSLSAEPPYGLELQGTLNDVLTRWSTDLRLDVTRAELAEIASGWPSAELGYAVRVSGNAAELLVAGSGVMAAREQGSYESSIELVYSPERLRIEQAAIAEQSPTEPLRLRASGIVDLQEDAPLVDLALNWERLRWPLTELATASSQQGELSLSGSLSDYRVRMSADLAVPNQTDGRVELLGSGGASHFATETFTLATLGGQVQADASVDWRDGLQSQAAIVIDAIDPSGLAPDWPGTVDAKAELRIHQTGAEAPIQLEVKTLKLAGELRGARLAGDLALSYNGGQLALHRSQFALGENSLVLAGTAADSIALEFAAQAADLALLAPGYSGTLSLEGTVTGQRDAPVVTTQAKAEDLRIAGHSLASASLVADLGLDPQYANDLRLVLTDYREGETVISAASVTLQGSQPQHELLLQLDSEQADVGLKLGGRITDLRRFAQDSGGYEFALQKLTIALLDEPAWSLGESGVGRVAHDQLSLQSTCLQSHKAQLCFAADWQQDRDTQIKLALTELPLERLKPLLPPELRLTGTLNGGGEIALAPTAISSELNFTTTEIELFADEDAAAELEDPSQDATPVKPIATFAPGQIALRGDPGQVLNLMLRLPLSTSGGVNADLSLSPELAQMDASTLSGTVRANLPDVGFVAELLPQVSRLKGTLHSELTVTGSLGSPQIGGALRFDDGEARLIGPDITLKDIELAVTGSDSMSGGPVPLQVESQLRSGDGLLTLSGEVLYSADKVDADLALKGERFRLLNNELAELYASPDLTLRMRGQTLELRGNIAIPEADITLKRVPESAVVPSDDQVLIAEDESEQSASRYSYAAAVTLALGEDVKFDGFGLNAHFTGDLRVRQASGEPALGRGEIHIQEGRYQAYGQDLKIETGRALWTDSPLAEPGIDLRALRKPRADVTVGVRARGLLANPDFSLFSEPNMGESDQLSYLVLGRPLQDNSSAESSFLAQAALAIGIRGGNFLSQEFGGRLGVDQIGIETDAGTGNDSAAFVVGKYLSPKLYVSYGLGLLDSVSTLKLEYLLSSKWRLVTESSTIDSGGDVIYTIERD